MVFESGHRAAFEAGYRAGAAALAGNPNVSSMDARDAYRGVHSKVRRLHGSWWVDGYCAALDLARGAYANAGAVLAVQLGLEG